MENWFSKKKGMELKVTNITSLRYKNHLMKETVLDIQSTEYKLLYIWLPIVGCKIQDNHYVASKQ